MSDEILMDRLAQLLMGTGDFDYDEARLRLDRASLFVSVDANPSPALQASAITAVTCAKRMFRGGVYQESKLSGRLSIGQGRRRLLSSVLASYGAQQNCPPDDALCLHIGTQAKNNPHYYVDCSGWNVICGPNPNNSGSYPGNVLTGAVAGALGVGALFQQGVLGNPVAIKRPIKLNLWGSNPPISGRIERLPSEIWVLGLGNLGQAVLYLLNMLPWSDSAECFVMLNDADSSGRENLGVQILTTPNWVGQKKTRAAATWLESHGFRTAINERRFSQRTRIYWGDPRIAVVGVDNLDARRWAATAGFDLVVDAGLGATSAEVFDIRIHAFPGAASPMTAWPENGREHGPNPMRPAHRKLLQQKRIDACGAMTIAGVPVGVTSTAVVAAALQLTQVIRALENRICADKIDVSLEGASRIYWRDMSQLLPPLQSVQSKNYD